MLRYTKRKPRGYRNAYIIVRWLNETQGRTGNSRVARLLETANKLGGIVKSGQLPAVNLLTWRPAGNKLQLKNLRKATRLANILEKYLSRYKVRPELVPNMKGHWYARWRPTTKHGQTWITVSADGDTYSFGEEDILLNVLDLAKEGKLQGIQRCDRCRRWYFAFVQHQRYCDRSCQQSNFRTNPKFKLKRKHYMRGYRREEHERNRQAKLKRRVRAGL